ncbi:MAG TPA: GGDEF domain-containing phosphodiesterase, partial [Thermoanaerobaculia bacterium]
DSSPIRVADRIRLALEEPVQVEGHAVHVTVSVGIAIATRGRHSAEDLLRDADTAMNRAKEAGRDRYVLFDEAMHQTAVSRLDLENALRRSVERSEIVVSYQPVVSVATEKLAGFEALIRWQHPRRGLLLPPEFVPIAEETGLVVPIGRFVLGEACRQLRAWNEGRAGVPLRMSVNLSPRQVASPSLVEEVETAVEAAGIDPRLLRLEITESVLLDRPEEALDVLSRLRALGVQLALDDFGTGYSSLGYLVRFPVQELKLDRAFVSRVHHGEREAAVARAILVLAHELGMTVTAEGVETEEQLAWLRAEGFDHVQGNLLSRPLPAAAAGLFVSGPAA